MAPRVAREKLDEGDLALFALIELVIEWLM